MIQLSSITFAYAHATPVFQGFSWRVARGERWALLGPSGCGKSTLLALLAGLSFPSAGQVLVDGQPIARPRPGTGFIIQDFGLLPWATVRENISLGLNIRRLYGPDGKHAPTQPAFAAGQVDAWLNRLGLNGVAGQYPGRVSGGQRQRAAIARTLVLRPDLLLMDEPFSALDAPTREDLQNLTLELCNEQDLTLLTVTHSIEEAAFMGRKILVLGEPPNRAPRVIENPGANGPDYRETETYQEICRELRQELRPA